MYQVGFRVRSSLRCSQAADIALPPLLCERILLGKRTDTGTSIYETDDDDFKLAVGHFTTCTPFGQHANGDWIELF